MALTSATPDPPSAAGRSGKRQKKRFRLKRAGLVVFVIVGILGLMGQAGPNHPGKVLRAERIILQDANRKVRAELGLKNGGPSLTLFDEQGKCRASLALSKDGSSSLSFYDKGGDCRAVLLVRSDGRPQLDLQAESVKPLVPPVKAAASPQLAKRLRSAAVLYRRLCQTCHGSDGRGPRRRSRTFAIPDLTDPAWHASRTNAQLVASIVNGRGEDMPPFDDRLSAEQAGDLLVYVRHFGPPNVGRTEMPSGDFETRFRQLQQQWEQLNRQIQQLSSSKRKP